jgi:hypothetical protein
MITTEDIRRWGGKDLLDPAGEKIGSIQDFYLQKDTFEPEWVVVKRDFLGLREKLVPFQAIEWREDYAVACYDKEQISHAPGPGFDGRLSDEEELKLFDHYGLSREEPLRQRARGSFFVQGTEDRGTHGATAERASDLGTHEQPADAVAEAEPADTYPKGHRREEPYDRQRMEEEARRAHPLSADLDEKETPPARGPA